MNADEVLNGKKGKEPDAEVHYGENNGSVTLISTKQLTMEEVLEITGVDTETWEAYDIKAGGWQTPSRRRIYNKEKERQSDELVHFQNWKITVKIRRIKPSFDFDLFKKELLEDAKAQSVVVSKYNFPVIVKDTKDRNLYMMSLNDLHLGRLSWHEESGKNYDSKIAAANFKQSFDAHMIKVQHYNIDQILFIVGNDLFNSDYHFPAPRTEYGTFQDSDVRWQKIARAGRVLVIDAINRLATIAPVHVMVIPGNHDPREIFHLGEALDITYYRNENVVVDNKAPRRKYFEYGKNLIGSAHGNKERNRDLLGVMVAEAREAIGRTKYSYFYMGHEHHEVVKSLKVKQKFAGLRTLTELDVEDHRGLIIDYLPNLAYRHAYEVEHGFVGTIRSSKCAIHNYERGRTDTFNHNL